MSFIIAFVKIMVAMLMVVFFGGKIRGLMLISLGVLFVSTILYESARENKNIWLIFFLVGIGYPLRFFVGFASIILVNGWTLLNLQTIFFMFALWVYGSFSSILAWTNEVVVRMQKTQKCTSVLSVLYLAKIFFHKMPSHVIIKRNGGGDYGKTKDLYY